MEWFYIILVIVGIAIVITMVITSFIVAIMIDEKRPYSLTSLARNLLEELEKERKNL